MTANNTASSNLGHILPKHLDLFYGGHWHSLQKQGELNPQSTQRMVKLWRMLPMQTPRM